MGEFNYDPVNLEESRFAVDYARTDPCYSILRAYWS